MKKRSFSLIEVVLACTVLILFLMSGLILFGTGMRNIVIAKHRLEAVYLANQAQSVALAWRDGKYFSGTYTLNWTELNTEMNNLEALNPVRLDGIDYTRTIPDVTDVSGIKKLNIEVSWMDFGKQYKIKSYSYIAPWQN